MHHALTPANEGGGTDGAALARLLFPRLASELDAALAQHGIVDTETLARQDHDAELDRAAATLLPRAAFSHVVDQVRPGEATHAERDFAAARTAARWLGLTLPEPEAFAEAGVPLAGVLHGLDAGQADEAGERTLVPTPFGLGLERWRTAFTRAADTDGGAAFASPTAASDETLPHSDDGAPLIVAAEAEREFARLDHSDTSTPRLTVAAVDWTLRAVPSGERPPVRGLGFTHGPHVALPEMLMLQLMRPARGVPPVDGASFTWLSGTIADGRLAARHVYDSSERAIRITCREIGNQGPHLGARSPVDGRAAAAGSDARLR